jgi:aryl-phospho-beta-D-glucosidase BglC (GH1 family)
MKKLISILIFSFIFTFTFSSCKDKEPVTTNTDSVVVEQIIQIAPDSLKFSESGGNDTIAITMNGSAWTVLSDQSWCTVSINTSTKTSDKLVVTTLTNTVASTRTAKLTFVMDYKKVITFKIIQAPKTGIYPSYKDSIAPDATGMSSTAMQLAQKIKVGLNIGNTLEASGGETGWGNPLITNDLIKAIKQNGFNAIRLPCSWDQYADQTTAKISDSWLARVKQVVQYCVDNDMYVIVNIHWDDGWLENNCTVAKQVANNAKQKAFWEQIAFTMRDFDEHVLFASANEPNVSDATQMSVLMSYHQTFINAVRSTGGKNAYRVLVVQGPSTDIAKTNSLMTGMPTDNIANKLMAEVHYYTPWNFCGMTADANYGNMFYYWGANYHSTTDTAHNPTWGEESDLNSLFLSMKTKFVDKGIPVIIGEFGAITRTTLTGDALKLHLASRAYFFKYVNKQSIADGFLPFFWDTGGLINRYTYIVSDQQALDGLIQGANGL